MDRTLGKNGGVKPSDTGSRSIVAVRQVVK